MRSTFRIPTLLLALVMLSGCYTELALVKPDVNSKRLSAADRYENSATPSKRTYTTNPNTANSSDTESVQGLYIDFENVPLDSYLGNQITRTDDPTDEEIRDYLNSTEQVGCDPLYFDSWNCTTDVLFRPNFSFNRWSHFNQWNQFGIGGIGLGFNSFFYDPFWFGPTWGPSALFWNDPWFSPFGWNNWAFGGFGWNAWNPWYPSFGFNGRWGNNGVFIAYNGDDDNITNSRRDESRRSNVGRIYDRTNASSRINQPKSGSEEVLRSARTTAYSPINSMRSNYTSNRRSARGPSTSRYSATTNESLRRGTLSSGSRRTFRGVSSSRYNQNVFRNSDSSSRSTLQNRAYRNASRSTSSRSYGSRTTSSPSRSRSTVSRSSGSSGRSSAPAKSSSRSTSRSKRGGNN